MSGAEIGWICVLALVSAGLYRIGGAKPKRLPWLPKEVFHGWVRDMGCTLCLAGSLLLMGVSAPWWSWVLMGALTYAAFTTYWDFVGFDSFGLHGVGIGLSLLPLVAGSITWWGPLVYAVGLGLVMHQWCAYFTNDHVEELGRGAFVILMAPLLLL